MDPWVTFLCWYFATIYFWILTCLGKIIPRIFCVNILRTTSSDMEGITHPQCKNLRRIFQLFSLASSYTWHSFPSIRTGHGFSHSCLNSKSTALAIPYVQSISLIVQGPLQLMQYTTGRTKAIIRDSCYPNTQNGIPTVTVNSKSASFPIFSPKKYHYSRDHHQLILVGTMKPCFHQ